MKVSLLISDLSANCLMRAYPAAKVLQQRYEVEIIGPALSGGVYTPYEAEFSYKADVFEPEWWRSPWKRRVLSVPRCIARPYSMITGDVVYAFKPRLASLGPALLAKYLRGRPLVLDIDDWDADEYFSASWGRRCRKLLQLGDPRNLWYTRAAETLTRFADSVTVNSTFLLRRFGGVMVPSAVDCNLFDPDRYDRPGLRAQWRVADKRVLLFTGQVTPHKGLHTLCEALQRSATENVVLMIAGPENGELRSLLETYPGLVLCLGSRPHGEMPGFLALADVVVLPQQRTPYAEAQVPGKLFEAMAMAKPIVATDVSDLPEILDGCGWVVPASDGQRLSGAIEEIFADPQRASAVGRRARQKCVTKYSFDAAAGILDGVFARYE